MRWWILAFVTLATALNYLDRQTLPFVITVLENEFPISKQDFSHFNSWFLLAYGIMYAVGGRIMDLLGTRFGYTLMIIWWSTATFLQGTVSSKNGFAVYRFLLGIGEGGGFPGSAKAVSEWFSSRERSFAFGVFNTGSALGAVVAAPLIAFIVYQLGWRWVFYITGAVGFVWAAGWLWYCPKSSPNSVLMNSGKQRWIKLFAYREVWGLIVAKALSDSAWFFFSFWMPKYLSDGHQLNIEQIGSLGWRPWVAAGVGSFGAGWLSSWLIKRGLTIDRSRKILLVLTAVLLPSAMLLTSVQLFFVIAIFCVIFLGHQAWATILQTLPADLFPPEQVGSAAGLLGASGSLAAAGFSLLAGHVVERFGYGTMFTIAGLMHPLSLLIVFVMVPKIRRIA
jgi:ACS family hexuronate transporter-like MFS transporter